MAERPLRILFATARYLPERGGTEIHTHEVATRLAARGAEVTVASTALHGPFARESQEGGVRVLRVRAWPPNRDYYLAPALARVIRKNKVDLVHCQGYHTLVAPLVMLAALSARIPYVVSLHSGGHSSALRRMLRPLQAWLLRPLLVRARRLVAVSPFEAELFARRLRLPPSAFVVIPSGVDLPPLPPAQPTATPPLILSIGRLESYKGHQRVVEALLTVNRARPGTRLRIVGTGPYEPQLRRLVDRLGLRDLVEIAPVPADRREEMARLLQQAQVVTMLSEYESQGLAIQEALALARPLVIVQGTALADLERHPNVRTVPRDARSETVGAAILELLDAPPAVAPPLPTWEECVGALLDLYKEAMAEGAARIANPSTPGARSPDSRILAAQTGEVSSSAPASVTVVVPTCRNVAALERALTSILRTGYERLDIVVVENRPPAPATRTLVEDRFAGQPVRYVEEPTPGLSRARNAGLAHADGDIVAFTDDDVVVDERWVHRAVAAFAHAGDVACVTGRILPLMLQTPAQRLFDQLAAFDKGVERRVFRLAETRAVEPLFPYVAGHVGSGANMFVRRDVALRMGGFDPMLGTGTPTLGGEDLDLFIRLAHDGVGILYDPTVIIMHDHPDSLAGIRRHAYSYGIGVTAMLAKQLIHGPERRQMLQRIPAGVRYVLSPSSRKNRQKSSEYPRTLDTLERLGMIVGPWTYLLSLAESVRRSRRRPIDVRLPRAAGTMNHQRRASSIRASVRNSAARLPDGSPRNCAERAWLNQQRRRSRSS